MTRCDGRRTASSSCGPPVPLPVSRCTAAQEPNAARAAGGTATERARRARRGAPGSAPAALALLLRFRQLPPAPPVGAAAAPSLPVFARPDAMNDQRFLRGHSDIVTAVALSATVRRQNHALEAARAGSCMTSPWMPRLCACLLACRRAGCWQLAKLAPTVTSWSGKRRPGRSSTGLRSTTTAWPTLPSRTTK